MAPERPTIVCLCGSTRFWREFQAAGLRETLAGKIVLSIGAASGTDEEHFGDMPREEQDRIKRELDELHLRKIDLADEVLILNVGGYIGESTRRELDYARSLGKTIRFLEELKELTLELTDYCPFGCSYCSSSSTHDRDSARYLPFDLAQELIDRTEAEIIHLSGGEPVAHPDFFSILYLARQKVGRRNVVLHTNMIEALAFNLGVHQGVEVHGYITPRGVDRIHVLKRIEQGREKRVPVVTLSRNFREGDGCREVCNHTVVRPDGTAAISPCRKDV